MQTIAGKRVHLVNNYIGHIIANTPNDRVELKRFNGDKPTQKQIKAMLHRMRNITPMQSARVLDGIAQSMMPEKT